MCVFVEGKNQFKERNHVQRLPRNVAKEVEEAKEEEENYSEKKGESNGREVVAETVVNHRTSFENKVSLEFKCTCCHTGNTESCCFKSFVGKSTTYIW